MLSNSFQAFLNGLVQHSGPQRRVTRASRRRLRAAKGLGQPAHVRWAAEALEDRLLLSATPTAAPTFIVEGRAIAPKSAQPAASPSVQPAFVAPLNPTQMQAAYGVNLISFNGVKGTGQGQTIAIVDAYNDPDIIADANSFSSTFGLQQFNVGGPTLQVFNETGGTSLSGVPNSSPGGWDVEESLDVEWAHSIAPMANIILFEANSSSFYDLLTAEQTAAATAGVSTVSNSWASGEFSGEQSYDSYFVTPNGHQGVTFLASTGDDGAPAGYPAYSPHVVAVGGTSLDLNASGTYQAESGWSGSGGGVSGYETQPSYQNGKVNGTSATQRTAPDISIDADPNTGVYVLDSYDGGYLQVGGTSLACPMTAALVSIANQGRILNGLTTLDGYSQTLPALYSLSSANFHDITTGNNGFSAGAGYDLVTGIGSPIANDLVPALAGYQVSQPATVTAPLGVSINENGSYFTNSITAADSAATGTSDSMSLSVINGTLALGSTTGLTFNSGSNNASSMTVTGTLANLNAALSGLVYNPTSGFSGADYLQISVYDANNKQTGWATVNVTVNPTTPPSVTAPSSVGTNENQSYTFSNTVSVTDAFASGTSESASISVGHGILTLSSTTGLTFTQGLNASASMTFSGTLANVNAALAGLVYTPTNGYSGSDSLPISVKDSTDNMTGSATVGITVNALPYPSLTVPASIFAWENYGYTFTNAQLGISDSAASGSSDSITLSVSKGIIILGNVSGITFTGGSDNASSMTITGTLSSLNNAINGITYAPNSGYTGTDALQLSATNSLDNLTATATVNINVSGTPIVTTPANISLNENSTYTFSNAVSITDYTAPGPVSLAIGVADGKLTLASIAGLSFTSGSNGSSSMTVSGSVSALNTALNGLVYAPTTGYSGGDTLNLTVTDPWDDNQSGSGSTAITVIALTPPKITAPASITLNENSSHTFSGTISAADALASGTSDSLSLSVADGKLALGSTTGLTITNGGNNSSSVTVTGTLANLNAALNGLVYTPTSGYSGSDSLQMLLSDSGDSLSGSASVAITVNAPPSVVAPSAASVNENSTLTFPGNISVTDAAASGTSDSVSISVADGKLTLGSTTGLIFNIGSNNSSSMTVTGTLTNLNAALNGLVYTPNNGYSGSDSLAVSAKDSGDNLSGSATVAITVEAIPIVTAPANANVTVNGSFTFSGTITATDAAASGSSDSVTLTVGDGTLTLGSITGLTFTSGGNGSSSMIVNGTMANLNAALNGLVYAPTNGYMGSDSLHITLKDAGDNLSGAATVAITVSNFPPPSVTAPATVNVNQNGTLTFSGTISVSDSAASGTSDSLTLAVANGKLALGSTTGLTFTTGSNNSSSMTVTGTLANLNAALNGLAYTPTANFSGHDSLQISVTDSGDELTGSTTVAINVNPFVTAPASVSVLESSSFTFSSPNYPITLTDAAATATSDSLTVTVLEGKLNLGTTSGLTFTSGANGTASMTIKGTLASLNAALNGLVYTPHSGYTGSDTLTITVADSGDGLSGSAQVAITVAPRKIVVGITLSSDSQSMPLDETTTDDSTQWAGVTAALDLLDE